MEVPTKKLNVCFINMDMSVVPTSYIVSCHAWFKTCDIYAQTMLTQYLQILGVPIQGLNVTNSIVDMPVNECFGPFMYNCIKYF